MLGRLFFANSVLKQTHALGLMRRQRCRSRITKEFLLLLGWVVDAVVELLDGVDEEDGSCEFISPVIPKKLMQDRKSVV